MTGGRVRCGWTVAACVAGIGVAGPGCRGPEPTLPPPKVAREPEPAPAPEPRPAGLPPRPEFPRPGPADEAERRAATIRDECFAVAEAIVSAAPADPAGWTLLGTVHDRFGDAAGADAAWDRALELDPRNGDALRQIADGAVRRGDLETAEARYRDAIDVDPDAVSVVERLVETLLAKDDLEGAGDLLSAFVAGRPRSVEGWCRLGAVRLREGRAEAAARAYRRALEVDPSARDAVDGLAVAVRAEEGVVPPPIAPSRLLVDRREASRAAERIDAAASDGDLASWAGAVHFWAATALARIGESSRAVMAWQRAIELDPADGDSREALALHLAATGRTRDAMRVRQAWCDREPDNPAAWFGKARLALDLGLADEAVVALRTAVALAPERPEGHALLARALADSDPPAAIAAARLAAEIAPSAAHFTLLGRLLAAAGETASASAALERAVALDPGDVPARQTLERLRRRANEPPAPGAPAPDGG